MSLNAQEIERYQRHLSLAGFGAAAQERLKRSSVLVIGAGGLGCPALLYLAAAGVGRIVIVDSDRVEVSNLQRQVLFTTEDKGKHKAEAARARLLALNPLIEVEAHVTRFVRSNALGLVGSVDLVVDGSDNFATRYLVNDACVLAGKPLVYGAIQGFEGQLSVFNFRGGPTYRCLFPEPPEPGTVPNCSENGVLGVLPGIIGTLQASEALKVLADIGKPASGRLLLIHALTMETTSVALPVDPASRQITELPPEGYGETCTVPLTSPDEVTPGELRAALAGDRPPQLIDVREAWERALGQIAPSCHLPLGELAAGNLGAIESLDPTLPTVVYCAHGMRSLRGMSILRERYGFSQVVSLSGGYAEWSGTD